MSNISLSIMNTEALFHQCTRIISHMHVTSHKRVAWYPAQRESVWYTLADALLVN